MGRWVSNLERTWPTGLLLGMVIAFFWDSFFDGKILFMRDTFFYSVPVRAFAAQAEADGSLPLWNPYSAFGHPFLAEPLSALFYPFQVLYCLLPVKMALKLSLALHLLIGALTMYGLCRSWKLDKLPSLLASVCFTFGAFLIAYMEFQTFFSTIVWWPLSILLFNMLLKVWEQFENGMVKKPWARSIPGTLLLALCFAIQFLAGHPEAFLLCCLLQSAYATAKAFSGGHWKTRLPALCCLAVSFAMALGLVAYQLFPTLELIPHSMRAMGMDAGIETGSLHPRQLFLFIIPFLFGRPGYPDQWAEGTVFEFWGAAFYVGLIPLLFASLGPLYRKSYGEHSQIKFLFLFFALAALFSFLMATGKHTGLYLFFHKSVPFFSSFRQPCKWLLWAAYSIPVLSAVGFQVIINERGRPLGSSGRLGFVFVWAGWGIVFILLVACYVYASQAPANFVQWITGGLWNPTGSAQLSALMADLKFTIIFFMLALISLGAFVFCPGGGRKVGILLPLLVFGNLFVVNREIHPILNDDVYDCCSVPSRMSIQSSPYFRVHSIYATAQEAFYACRNPDMLRWACDAFIGEIGLSCRLLRTSIGGGLPLNAPLWIWASLDEFPHDVRDRIADMLSIRYVVGGEAIDEILWGGASRKLFLVERHTWLPRAIVVTKFHRAENMSEALSQVLSPDFSPEREAVVEILSDSFLWESPKSNEEELPKHPSGKLHSIRYKWNQVDLEIDSAQGGLLVFNEAWYPGWEAWVDGRSQPIHRVNGIFQGVFVGKGMHRVRFIYSPRLFYLGIVVAGGISIFMLGLAWYWVRTSRKTEKDGHRPN